MLARCRVFCRGRVGRANPRHTCTPACRQWIDHKSQACVCLDSLNVHLCGDRCNLPARVSMDGDAMVCPLTHIVLPGHITMQIPQFDANKRPVVHWSRQKIKGSARRAPKKTCLPHKKCTAHTAEQLIVKCFDTGNTCAGKRLATAQKRVLGGIRKSNTGSLDFFRITSLIHQHSGHMYSRPCKLTRLRHKQRAVAEIIGEFVSQYICIHKGIKWANVETAVTTILSLLAKGWMVNNVPVVECVPLVKKWMPLPQDVGQMPKINCRNISTGTRAFKAYVLNKDGLPIHNKCLRLSQNHHRQLFCALHG